jgi:hypothetical protein
MWAVDASKAVQHVRQDRFAGGFRFVSVVGSVVGTKFRRLRQQWVMKNSV